MGQIRPTSHSCFRAAEGLPARRATIALAVYAFINLLFVYKYARRAGLPSGLAVAAYLVAVAVLAGTFGVFRRSALARRVQPAGVWALASLAAIAMAFFMRRFDPAAIEITRYAAIDDWLSRILSGQFPYASAVRPSAFPFLFVLALPFRWLGDIGLMQIAAIPAFTWACLRQAKGDATAALGAVLLLLCSPLFLFEVAARSELTTNATLVLLWLVWVERGGRLRGTTADPAPTDAGRGMTPLQAIVAGLLLSTRGITALVHTIFFVALFRDRPGPGLRFASITILTFAATVLPFVLWEPRRFMDHGPFAIQISYIPFPFLLIAFATAAGLGMRARTWDQVHLLATLALTGVVGVLFASSIAREGWNGALMGNRFDIGYFAFAHTLLIFSQVRPGAASQHPGAISG